MKLPIPEGALLVSYCDFFVEWDFQKFVIILTVLTVRYRLSADFIPHPLVTFYAYMRTDADGGLLNCRKSNPLPQRHEEPASAEFTISDSSAFSDIMQTA